MVVTSPNFEDGGWLDDLYSGYGLDISPEFDIDDIPSNALSLAVCLDDLDHPIHPGFNHYVAWNIQPKRNIGPHIPAGECVDHNGLSICQGLAYRPHRYAGPKPPFNWLHRYLFTFYSLDCVLNISTDSTKEKFLLAAVPHIIQSARISCKYQRRRR